jgi:hypothetical protein
MTAWQTLSRRAALIGGAAALPACAGAAMTDASRRELLKVAGIGALVAPLVGATALTHSDSQLPALEAEWRSICADVGRASAVINDELVSEDTPAFAAAEETLDEAVDHRSEFIRRVAGTPLRSHAGIVFKLSIAATIISEGNRAHDEFEDTLVLSAHADAEELHPRHGEAL